MRLYICPMKRKVIADRSMGPVIRKINNLVIPKIDVYEYQNGTQVCEVNYGSQDILKIEIVHKAGRTAEIQRLASRATAKILTEGTRSKTSEQIADEIDFYGSSIKTAANMDFASTTFYGLLKHGVKAIPLLGEIYNEPAFPQSEIDKFIKQNIQKLRGELTRNEAITYRQITESIFGADHPYGYNSSEDLYHKIDRKSILDHYENCYGTDNRYIFISGKITDKVRDELYKYFGSDCRKTRKVVYPDVTVPEGFKRIELKSHNEHQGAIKTGFRLFDKSHPNNASFFVLNTILGGYFGSRLMTRIRENLGYTYDIFSSVDQMLYDGCFYVSTESAPEYIDPVLGEIYHEMDVLKSIKVSNRELEMVKSYLSGNFLNMIDGPLHLSVFAKMMVLIGKEPSEFIEFADEILRLTPKILRETAQKYFDKNKMTEIIVLPH